MQFQFVLTMQVVSDYNTPDTQIPFSDLALMDSFMVPDLKTKPFKI
jgi:hypothetical protein